MKRIICFFKGHEIVYTLSVNLGHLMRDPMNQTTTEKCMRCIKQKQGLILTNMCEYPTNMYEYPNKWSSYYPSSDTTQVKPGICFKVKSVRSGYLVKLGCGREIVFKDKTSVIDAISAYINDPVKTEKEFNIDEGIQYIQKMNMGIKDIQIIWAMLMKDENANKSYSNVKKVLNKFNRLV